MNITPQTKYIVLPFIVLYNNGTLWLEGNIYRTKKNLFIIKNKEHYWRNIIRVINSYLRGATRRLSLEIQFNEETYKVRTSNRGHFTLNISCDGRGEPDLSRLHVFLKRRKKKFRIEVPEPFNHCYFSYKENKTAVISDIDDTILVTHTQNALKKLRTLLVKNALKRKAVKEMKAFYIEFAAKGYPFFYVSNSESNLFPMIRLFLEHNKFPTGPIFLKPFVKWNQIFKKKKKQNRGRHKKEKIEFLLKKFPDMNFILIGDDSQRDPEIYADLAQAYSDRVSEVYIRNVKNKINKKRAHLQSRITQNHNIKFIFFTNPSQLIGEV